MAAKRRNRRRRRGRASFLLRLLSLIIVVAAIVAALKTDIKIRVKNFFIEYIRTPAGVFSIYIRV